jgi:hypothetical protein
VTLLKKRGAVCGGILRSASLPVIAAGGIQAFFGENILFYANSCEAIRENVFPLMSMLAAICVSNDYLPCNLMPGKK